MRLHWRDLGCARADRASGKLVELTGFARMVDVAGIDHVGLGTDLLGLVGASTLVNYNDLPQLAAALRGKFTPEETAKLLGGNYRRVFQASLGG